MTKKLNITIAPETEQFLSTPQDGVNVMYTHWLAGNPQTHSFTVSNEMHEKHTGFGHIRKNSDHV